MAVGAPALVSPVGVNATIVADGIHGFHCTSEEEWLYALRQLIQDRQLRQQMGTAARAHVETNYSVKYQLPRMIEIFKQVSKSDCKKIAMKTT
jgi:glycosyltransferase involved in cell wall biosynthesis